MSTETLTFANFSPVAANPVDMYEIGADQTRPGVIPEMAEAFGHILTSEPRTENLADFVAAVGPAKELQYNIARVQERLGTDQSALDIARDWVIRSGLLTPVKRSLMDVNQEWPEKPSTIVITDAIRNWMERRRSLAEELIASNEVAIGSIMLASGRRMMSPSEGEGVTEGLTADEYMWGNLLPRLRGVGSKKGVGVYLTTTENTGGDEVMDSAVVALTRELNSSTPIIVASNAGAWLQNAAQLRQAIKRKYPDRSPQKFDSQLFVAAKRFELGVTGDEPKETHQNPFSALGQIARNALQLHLLMKRS